MHILSPETSLQSDGASNWATEANLEESIKVDISTKTHVANIYKVPYQDIHNEYWWF